MDSGQAATPPNTTITSSTISVAAYAVPPSAPQPGMTATLDTLDTRFVNSSTQVGSNLYNVHTINLVGYAAPKWYQLNTNTNTVVQSGFFFRGPTSYDFNASIAANAAGQVFVTWNATDPPAGVLPENRFSGRLPSDPAGVIGAGSALPAPCNSNQAWPAFRWGDYSSTVLFIPTPFGGPSSAWITNENLVDQSLGNWWDTCSANISY